MNKLKNTIVLIVVAMSAASANAAAKHTASMEPVFVTPSANDFPASSPSKD